MLLSYKPLHLEAQQRLQEEGCVVDIRCHLAKSCQRMGYVKYYTLYGCVCGTFVAVLFERDHLHPTPPID